MGSASSKESLSNVGQTVLQNTDSSAKSDKNAASQHTSLPPEGCPMHEKLNKEAMSAETECPVSGQQAKEQAMFQHKYPSECPMHAANKDGETNKEDVLDPSNLMPPPNQQPSPGQPFSLPVEREKSNIPKGGTDETWVYPSQQMFWNAMLRKGWRWEQDALKQDDMDNIIRMHNFNNENAWQEILKWEAFHAHECGQPKLLKFGGKAQEFSPRARFRSWLGYDLPFDRHDWVVDRCGKEVRYIIDYYDIGDPDKYKQGDFVYIDVRPAFDSFEAVLDRSRVAMLRWAAQLSQWTNSKKSVDSSTDSDNKSSPR